jgi:hypothetical protein
MHSYPSFHDVAVASHPAVQEVKMFIHKDPREAERAVSAWLRENPVQIQHITQSQSEKGGHFVFVLSIFFQREQL